MDAKVKTWCERDEHKLFENYVDFNEWLHSEEAQDVREQHNIDGLRQPSKAFYASDKEAYDQALEEYRTLRLHEVLNENYLLDQFEDDHWFKRNLDHFDQLIQQLMLGNVVPFVGAGLSVDGGFPSWEDHLREQGRTAGIAQDDVEQNISSGRYESLIAEIENLRGRSVFIQEIRDVFSRPGEVTYSAIRVAELFSDSIITTNYDRLLERALAMYEARPVEVINGTDRIRKPSTEKVTIYKLHGTIEDHANCVLSKQQYDEAYGNNDVDLSLPLPKLIEQFYKNSSLLFLGCSLNNDRTVQVFRAIREKVGDIVIPQHFTIEQAPETEEELVERNAYLANLGITAIWFEKGQYEYVESILKQARNELRYRGIIPGGDKRTLTNTLAVTFGKGNLLRKILRKIIE